MGSAKRCIFAIRTAMVSSFTGIVRASGGQNMLTVSLRCTRARWIWMTFCPRLSDDRLATRHDGFRLCGLERRVLSAGLEIQRVSLVLRATFQFGGTGHDVLCHAGRGARETLGGERARGFSLRDEDAADDHT